MNGPSGRVRHKIVPDAMNAHFCSRSRRSAPRTAAVVDQRQKAAPISSACGLTTPISDSVAGVSAISVTATACLPHVRLTATSPTPMKPIAKIPDSKRMTRTMK